MAESFTKQGISAQIRNELRFLDRLQGSGFVPRLHGSTEDSITMDLLVSEPVTDADLFLINCCGLLRVLTAEGVSHGDLTDKNIMVVDNKPVVIDWAESRMVTELRRKDKRPEGDAYWLWQAYVGLTGDPRRVIRNWLAIREHLSKDDYLLDLGCWRGFTVLVAQSEGYTAAGRDVDVKVEFVTDNIFVEDFTGQPQTADVLLMSSVWPYLVRQRGAEYLDNWLAECLFRDLFFEAQLVGDGYGVFQSRAATNDYLKRFGAVRHLLEIPIPDRNTSRHLFKVTRESRG